MEREEALRLLNGQEKLTAEQVKEIFQGCLMSLKSYQTKGVGEMLVKLKEKLALQNNLQGEQDVAALDLIIVRAFRQDMHPWRGRKYANEALRLIKSYADEIKDNKQIEEVAKNLAELGDSFMSFMDFRHSYDAYYFADNLLRDNSLPLKMAANYANKWIIALKLMNTQEGELPTKEELEAVYKEHSSLPISALEGRGYLKHDPIEASEEFQKVYDEVMEDAYIIIDAFKGASTPSNRFRAIKQSFLNYGVEWKTPEEMNPGIMFK